MFGFWPETGRLDVLGAVSGHVVSRLGGSARAVCDAALVWGARGRADAHTRPSRNIRAVQSHPPDWMRWCSIQRGCRNGVAGHE